MRRCCPWLAGSAARDVPLCEDWVPAWDDQQGSRPRNPSSGIELGGGSKAPPPALIVASVLQALRKLSELQLPAGGPQLVAELQRSAERLSELLGSGAGDPQRGAAAAAALAAASPPWPSPAAEEHQAWCGLYPSGGTLLRTQVCIAAEGEHSEEWGVGRFFASDMGIVIEGAEESLQSGLVHWDEILRMESRLCGGIWEVLIFTELQSSLTASAARAWRLQLGLELDCRRLQDAWELLRDVEGRREFHSFMEEPQSMLQDLRRPKATTPIAAASSPLPTASQMTQSFVAACDGLSGVELGGSSEPLCTAHWPSVALAKVADVLRRQEDWPLVTFQTEVLAAQNLVASPWAQGQRMPGTRVRRLQFQFPAPEDAPRVVQKMLGMPKLLESTLVARLECSESQVSLTMQSCSHNVPYGDCQRIQDILIFRPHLDGGVEVVKFMEVVWVKALPWGFSPVKAFIEKKVLGEGKKTWCEFERIMLCACKDE